MHDSDNIPNYSVEIIANALRCILGGDQKGAFILISQLNDRNLIDIGEAVSLLAQMLETAYGQRFR